jgi:hypothetical protein
VAAAIALSFHDGMDSQCLFSSAKSLSVEDERSICRFCAKWQCSYVASSSVLNKDLATCSKPDGTRVLLRNL